MAVIGNSVAGRICTDSSEHTRAQIPSQILIAQSPKLSSCLHMTRLSGKVNGNPEVSF